MRKVGFSGIRMHDAGHTHATVILELGVNWKIMSGCLGQSNVAMILDFYAQPTPG